MKFVLSSENVVRYLQASYSKWQNNDHQSYFFDPQLVTSVTPIEYRNFNLIVNLANENCYLVKQERFNGNGKTSTTLKYEWVLQQYINSFPQLKIIQNAIAPIVYFDPENSILIVKYLPEYISLNKFYRRINHYPPEIAAVVGSNLAQIHRLTFRQSKYQDFLAQYSSKSINSKPSNFMGGLDKIGTKIFARICSDGLEFFKLYQRFPSFHQAVVELYENYQATCLTHNDLRLTNYLIKERNLSYKPEIKLIDWEFMSWGDPAGDLGTLIAKYLELWLDSLFVNSDSDLSLSLSLATCPLEKIQPSLTTILKNYLTAFPEITSHRPDFTYRTIQFAGLSILKQLQYRVECHFPFTNNDICSLQVAKSLLCSPERSLASIFGLVSSSTSVVA